MPVRRRPKWSPAAQSRPRQASSPSQMRAPHAAPCTILHPASGGPLRAFSWLICGTPAVTRWCCQRPGVGQLMQTCAWEDGTQACEKGSSGWCAQNLSLCRCAAECIAIPQNLQDSLSTALPFAVYYCTFFRSPKPHGCHFYTKLHRSC